LLSFHLEVYVFLQVMVEPSRKYREATRLTALTVNRMGGSKVPVNIDPQTGRSHDPNHPKFVSYLGVLTRTKVSILLPDWDHVTEVDKNLIW